MGDHMKSRKWPSGILLVLLAISGCAVDPKDSELRDILSGKSYSSGWVGVDVAYRRSDLSASHTIVSVAEGSPAARAGIKAGDEIWFVGQQNTGYIDVVEVTRCLRESTSPLDLKVKREGEKDLLAFVLHRADDKQHEAGLSAFESKAAEYRALKVKPPISEEQRKFIVQANAMSQQKEYAEALSRYLKAVEIDPVSYPAAYFNMALLSAQLQRYRVAITYMRQYLLLEPEATDARSAQDKIYEWEFLLERKKQ